MYARFFGGSHPAAHKETTRRKPTALPETPPEQVRLPLLGRKAVVPQGAVVKLGQCVAQPVSDDDVALNSSVSGKVVSITEEAIFIENDGTDDPADFVPWSEGKYPNARQLSVVLRGAGVMGMACGDSQSAHRKLTAAAAVPVDTLIINGIECDPWHTADHRLMAEEPRRVLKGAKILMHALGLKSAIIAVAGDKLDAAEALEDALGKSHISIRVLRARYPLGEERILTGVLTGRQVPLGGTPLSVGCVVFNAATAAAVCDAVKDGKPLTHRIVTVTGTAVVKPRNLLVPLGTPLSDLPNYTDGLRPGLSRCYVGGPMRGELVEPEETVVDAATTAVVFLRTASEEAVPAKSGRSACIRCGECVSACPMGLLPLYARTGEEGAREACVACGACDAVCPARLPLMDWMTRKEGGK